MKATITANSIDVFSVRSVSWKKVCAFLFVFSVFNLSIFNVNRISKFKIYTTIATRKTETMLSLQQQQQQYIASDNDNTTYLNENDPTNDRNDTTNDSKKEDNVVVELTSTAIGSSVNQSITRIGDTTSQLDEVKHEREQIIYMNDPNHVAFPRWDDPNGISIRTMLEFLNETLYDESVTTLPRNRLNQNNTTKNNFQEVFYVFDSNGLYVSLALRNRTATSFVNYRLRPIQKILRHVFRRLKYMSVNKSTTTNQYQRLLDVFMNGPGIPFFLNADDYKGCGYNNWNRNNSHNDDDTDENNENSTDNIKSSIPIFTFAAAVECNYSFPIPTYKTIYDSKDTLSSKSSTSSVEWDAHMLDWNQQYPIQSKIRKIVWRGGLTGPLLNFTSPRWSLPSLITTLSASNETIKNMFDVGIHKIPARHAKTKMNLTQIGGLATPIFPSDSFQKYYGIIDIDGNSWSSRFGSLLCYNSVILKVDAKYVDYFYYPSTNNSTADNNNSRMLLPWKHYVPIQYDLSDLIEKSEYVLDPKNDKIIQQIVQNANEWCKDRMTYRSIATDYVNILERYVQFLDKNNPNWTTIWNKFKYEHIFNSKNNDSNEAVTKRYDMVLL